MIRAGTIGRAWLSAAALLGAACSLRQPGVPEGPLPAFALQAQDGRRVTRADLAGRAWVANFIFTRCAGICPAMTAHLARLRPRLPAELRLVSFTVDPVHDTPAVLTEYARPWNPGGRWWFLTGPQPELYALATEGFKLAAMEVPPDQQAAGGDGPFLHSSRFVLLDARAHIVGYYDSAEPEELERLVRDAQRLERRSRRWPLANAGLNAASAVLLLAGLALVRSGRRAAHRRAMLAALACSVLFLASYLAYHASVGSVPFLGSGGWRRAYLALLISHSLLAIAIVPLAGITVVRAWKGQLERHRRVARLTWPLWLYVSVSGVLVYLAVYQL